MDHVRFPLGLLSDPRDTKSVRPFVAADPDTSRGASAVIALNRYSH